MAKKPKAGTVELPPATDESEANKLAPRFSVTITPEGRVAWDRTRANTREQLKLIVNDPALASELGVVPVGVAATSSGSESFPPEMCGVLYDALSMVLVAVAQRSGYPGDRANALKFTDGEKAMLAGPTADVLKKYNVSMGKYQEELTLALTMGTIITGKLALLRAQPMAVRPTAEPSTVSEGA